MTTVYIIAEAGVNHNGSPDLARRLVDVAAASGVDAVKFQTFKADRLVTRRAIKAEYQTKTTAPEESQFDMIRRLELDEAMHRELVERAAKRGIQFLSTPFDLESLDLLASRLDLPRLKISSGDVTNGPLLLAAARTRKPVILSTGMANMAEIEAALGALAYGYLEAPGTPSPAAFEAARRSAEGRAALAKSVCLLHCTTEYPAPLAEVNLRAMDSMAARFGLPVGYSDHTQGIAVSIAAAARGATVIEKHFTLDRSLPGPDHAASLEPDELEAMVASIRDIAVALGSEEKQPTAAELKNIPVARRSLVAIKNVAVGELFTESNLGVKRPGTGISPMKFWEMLGKAARRSYHADDLVDE